MDTEYVRQFVELYSVERLHRISQVPIYLLSLCTHARLTRYNTSFVRNAFPINDCSYIQGHISGGSEAYLRGRGEFTQFSIKSYEEKKRIKKKVMQ